jgi:inosine/xanthosine triphosphate pyrophosphatase family protein
MQNPPPVKRGRGRPRKYPKPIDEENKQQEIIGSCPPTIPSKIEVVMDKKEERSATDIELKKLRAKLKKSQLRVREIESVLTSSLIHIVHQQQPPPPTTTIIKEEENTSSSQNNTMTERAERLVNAKRNLSMVKDLSSLERLKRELEQSLDSISKSLQREQMQLKVLQNRFQKINSSIKREMWRISITNNNTKRINELKQLLQEQTMKFNTLSENANTRIQILSTRNESTLTQYKETLEDIKDAKDKQREYQQALESFN